MALDPRRYISTLWMRVKDIPSSKDAHRELAQKVEQLARDLSTASDSGIPSGAIIYWLGDESTIPKGWSRATELDGRFPRGMTGTTGAGVVGGSDTHSHSMTHTHTGAADADAGSKHYHSIGTDTHNHSISTDTHSHTIGLVSGYAGGGGFNANDVNNTGSTSHNHGGSSGNTSHNHGTATGPTGNPALPEGAHSHNLTINNYTGSTGTQSTLPSYIDGLWIRKD